MLPPALVAPPPDDAPMLPPPALVAPPPPVVQPPLPTVPVFWEPVFADPPTPADPLPDAPAPVPPPPAPAARVRLPLADTVRAATSAMIAVRPIFALLTFCRPRVSNVCSEGLFQAWEAELKKAPTARTDSASLENSPCSGQQPRHKGGRMFYQLPCRKGVQSASWEPARAAKAQSRHPMRQ